MDPGWGAVAVAVAAALGAPVAASLRGQGARLGLVLAYLGLAGVCRVPMALFEASFLGPAFTVVRFAVSLPLVILVSELLGAWLERRGYETPGGGGHRATAT